MSTAGLLRATSQRLSSTTVEELPRYVGFLASSLLQCADLIKAAEARRTESSPVIHKIKTRITSLLQDRTQEGRFVGVVLLKAIIDAGDVAILASALTWTRALLSGINKQDVLEVKKLMLIALTRIYCLTIGQASHVREITTPTLPGFITACLGLIRPTESKKPRLIKQVTSSLIETVFSCWVPLIREFPSVFRPYVTSLRAIILDVLSDDQTPEHVVTLSIELLSALHYCAPKNAAADEWSSLFQQVVISIHQHSDIIFRSVTEEWSLKTHLQVTGIGGKISSDIKSKDSDTLGLGKWSGMNAGVHRLVVLLRLLAALVGGKQLQVVTIPLAETLDLSGRLLAVVPISAESTLQKNAEIGREERDEMYASLSYIHAATLSLLCILVRSHGQQLRPCSRTIMTQMLDGFDVNDRNDSIREMTYILTHDLCMNELASVDKSNATTFAKLIRRCCEDLKAGRSDLKSSKDRNDTMNGDNVGSKQASKAASDSVRVSIQSAVRAAAWNMVPTLLVHLSTSLSFTSRTEIDSTIILVNHQDAMTASVLNPAPSRRGKTIPSILPFLARTTSASLAVEAFLRPRMPIMASFESRQASDIDELAIEEAVVDVDMLDHGVSAGDDSKQNRMDITQPEPMSGSDLLPQKRMFTTFESEASPLDAQTSDAPKRLRADPAESDNVRTRRFDSPDLIQKQMATQELVVSDTLGNGQETSIRSQVASSLAKPLGSNISHERSFAVQTISQQAQHANQKAEYPDSSDDDEIPTIDATISDDESGEDEEAA